MSTSGGFTPPDVPECPYAPRMTRAAAIALRAAGGLLENCVVVITDAPTIGTAGNVSPTEIELNPVSPTELGTTARVHTAFASSAWPGIYDIDLGTDGSITQLTDDFGNTVKDVDADSPTVHTQFPWHAGSATIRDNRIEDAVLVAWDTAAAAGATITDNVIGTPGGSVTHVDLTGLGASMFSGNTIACTVDITTALPAGSAFTDNIVRDDFALNLAPGAGHGIVTVDGNTFYDHLAANAGYDFVYTGATTSILNIQDSEFRAQGATPQIQIGGAGTLAVQILASKFNSTVLTRNAATVGLLSISQCDLVGGTYDLSGAGSTVSLTTSKLTSNTVTRDVTATTSITISASTVTGATVTAGAGAAASINIANSDVNVAQLILNPGVANKSIGITQSKVFGNYRIVVSDTGGSGFSGFASTLYGRPVSGDSVNVRGVGGFGISLSNTIHDGDSVAPVNVGSIDFDTAAQSGSFLGCEIINRSRINAGPGSAAFQMNGAVFVTGFVNHLSTARLTINRSFLVDSGTVNTGVAATANLQLNGCHVEGSGSLVELLSGPRELLVQTSEVLGGSIIRQSSTNTANVPNSNRVDQSIVRDGGRIIFSETAAAGFNANSVNRSTVKGNSLGPGVDGILTFTGVTAAVLVDALEVLGIATLTDVPAGALSAGTAFHDLRVGPASTLTYTAGDATAKQIRNIAVEDLSTLTITGLTGSAGAGLADVFGGRVKGQSTMIVTGARVAGQPVRNFTVEDGSTLNIAASGTVLQCQVRAGATLNTGAFRHSESVVEGAIVKTATAANTNKLANKSFDDWL